MVAVVAVAGAGFLAAIGRYPTSVAVSSATTLSSATPSYSVTPSATPTSSPTSNPTSTPDEVPTTGATPLPVGWSYSYLDGAAAPDDLAHRLPLAIMIDDVAAARPQSGLSSASIVYQAMIDSLANRYMLIFQEGTATDIGPVRSARPYYVSWAAEYKALFGHFGGDAETLQRVIPAMSAYIYNEDDLSHGSCPYHRIATRPAPHNAYTNSSALISCAAKRDYPAVYQALPTRTFVDDTPAGERPASQTISIPYVSEKISYLYDPVIDSYFRFVNGQTEIDPANGQPVMARDIVVLFQPYAIVPSLDEMRPKVTNVGSGKAIVFEEGRAIAGTWKKPSNVALTQVYDAQGKPIPLVRGELFIQSVPPGTAVTYG
jgi:Protein of unknown function (DUF3048) N-terminal domain/Protein of unknown function (DUF3048) C-terminal domain